MFFLYSDNGLVTINTFIIASISFDNNKEFLPSLSVRQTGRKWLAAGRSDWIFSGISHKMSSSVVV